MIVNYTKESKNKNIEVVANYYTDELGQKNRVSMIILNDGSYLCNSLDIDTGVLEITLNEVRILEIYCVKNISKWTIPDILKFKLEDIFPE